MNSAHADFVSRLLREVPELQGVYDEHLEDYDELIAHVFMADVVRWLVDQYPQGGDVEDSGWRRLVTFVEDQYRVAVPDVENLLVVSFVENLPAPGAEKADIAGYLGPGLAEVYREIFTVDS